MQYIRYYCDACRINDNKYDTHLMCRDELKRIINDNLKTVIDYRHECPNCYNNIIEFCKEIRLSSKFLVHHVLNYINIFNIARNEKIKIFYVFATEFDRIYYRSTEKSYNEKDFLTTLDEGTIINIRNNRTMPPIINNKLLSLFQLVPTLKKSTNWSF